MLITNNGTQEVLWGICNNRGLLVLFEGLGEIKNIGNTAQEWKGGGMYG